METAGHFFFFIIVILSWRRSGKGINLRKRTGFFHVSLDSVLLDALSTRICGNPLMMKTLRCNNGASEALYKHYFGQNITSVKRDLEEQSRVFRKVTRGSHRQSSPLHSVAGLRHLGETLAKSQGFKCSSPLQGYRSGL